MKEIRQATTNIEIREENNSMIVEGYAVTFNQETVLFKSDKGDEYKEVIQRDAFNEADMKDVVLRYNHKDNYPILARSRGGSLALNIDDYGVKVRANLFDTQASRDVYELVKAGALDKMSFAFTVKSDSYDRSTRTRSIDKVGKLVDVAIVDFPAYNSTSISARSFFDEKIEEEMKEAEEVEREKIKLKIKLG